MSVYVFPHSVLNVVKSPMNRRLLDNDDSLSPFLLQNFLTLEGYNELPMMFFEVLATSGKSYADQGSEDGLP
jgi:hypothetical protein